MERQGGRYVWGNLNKKQACAAGSPCEGKPLGEWVDQTSDSKNQIVGFCYDAAGNVIRWAPCPGADMTYDAENRLVSVNGVTYTYDGDGTRVRAGGPPFPHRHGP